MTVLVLMSCQKDEFDIQNINQEPTTRSSTNPSEIRDLCGLEINIRLADTSRKPRYLSAHRKSNSANLTQEGKDEWQKWFILGDRYSSNGAFDLKTNSSPRDGSYLYIHDNWKYPALLHNYAGSTPQWYIHNIEGTDYYRIGLLKSGVYYYLSAVDNTSGALCFEPKNSTNYKRQAWEIVPLEGFSLVGIEYDFATGVVKNPRVVTFLDLPSINELPVYSNREFTINEKYIDSSEFSKTEGTKLGVSTTATIKTGIPTVQGEFSTTISTEKNWSYTTSEKTTKEFAITDKYSFVQAPNTSYAIIVRGIEYEMDINYKAVYRSEYGATVKLGGKWTGVTVKNTEVILKDNSTGNIIGTKKLAGKVKE